MLLGPYSILLLIGIVQGIVFAVLLCTLRRNRFANRFLALLLVLIVISLIQSTIGFAGAYDRYPWLTFAPFVVTLGFGPALWLYVRQLTHELLPNKWWLHLLPLAAQVAFRSLVFAQPLDWRYEFISDTFEPLGSPIEAVLGLISAAVYWVAAFRLNKKYRSWAPQHVSDSENYNLDWLRNFLVGAAIGFVVWAGFEMVNETIRPLSYEAFFWLDLVAATLLYSFAIAGYRHSQLAWPAIDTSSSAEGTRSTVDLVPREGAEKGSEIATVEAEESSAERLDEPGYDWVGLAQELRDRMSERRWYLDADLTLESLAGHLSKNTWTLSRTINEGAGCNFNDFVNAYRVDSVCECLADPADDRTLLEIALESGFNSKTSFNRSFKKSTGETPSECRKRLRKGARS